MARYEGLPNKVGLWLGLLLLVILLPRYEIEEVIQAWYMDKSHEDQKLPHHREPKEFVSLKKLAELGVLSFRLNADIYETDEQLKKIREDRGYSYMDIFEACPEKLPNYEEMIKNVFKEHLHADEEIRYCLEGSGYFDVRDENDHWIRVSVKKGGMIIIPAGIYHRFTLDTGNYIKVVRCAAEGRRSLQSRRGWKEISVCERRPVLRNLCGWKEIPACGRRLVLRNLHLYM